jgi:hypothetical protein
MVSELPTVLRVNAENQPHCATGPSHRWLDGRELHYWRGVLVPKEWIESPGSVDPKIGLTWENVEQRRALVEIIGWGKVIASLNTRTLERHNDPEMGELLECAMDDDDGRPGRFLKVRCGTGRSFVLRVSPDCQTVEAAQRELWQVDLYQPEVRT